jgi:hypothetical protein
MADRVLPCCGPPALFGDTFILAIHIKRDTLKGLAKQAARPDPRSIGNGPNQSQGETYGKG